MAGPAATEPCVVYAQLLKPLCLDQLFGEHGCHFTCQDVRSKKECSSPSWCESGAETSQLISSPTLKPDFTTTKFGGSSVGKSR